MKTNQSFSAATRSEELPQGGAELNAQNGDATTGKKTRKAKVKKPRSEWSNPRAGYPQQYLAAAISESSLNLLPDMTNEELSVAQDALALLQEKFKMFFESRSEGIQAARVARQERLAKEKAIQEELDAAKEARKLALEKKKALRASKATA